MDTSVSNNPSSSNTSNPPMGEAERAQVSFTLLLFLAAIGIGLGFFGIYKSIGSPFTPETASVATLSNTQDDESVSSLQQKDTDQDGLSDYDELYRYNTSPYLADSDSDNLTDKEELESGNDPNCPTGQDCTGFTRPETDTETSNSTTDATVSTNSNTSDTSTTNSASPLPTTETGEVDLDQLREILKSSGAPAYIVDGTDDATLIELYESTLLDQESTLDQTDTSLLDDSATLSLDALSDLPASEIRSLLIESGVDQNLINQVSDEDLKSIFQDAVLSETSQ